MPRRRAVGLSLMAANMVLSILSGDDLPECEWKRVEVELRVDLAGPRHMVGGWDRGKLMRIPEHLLPVRERLVELGAHRLVSLERLRFHVWPVANVSRLRWMPGLARHRPRGQVSEGRTLEQRRKGKRHAKGRLDPQLQVDSRQGIEPHRKQWAVGINLLGLHSQDGSHMLPQSFEQPLMVVTGRRGGPATGTTVDVHKLGDLGAARGTRDVVNELGPFVLGNRSPAGMEDSPISCPLLWLARPSSTSPGPTFPSTPPRAHDRPHRSSTARAARDNGVVGPGGPGV